MSRQRVTAYLASHFGFSEVTREFMAKKYLPRLRRAGITPINPWGLTTQKEIDEVYVLKGQPEFDEAVSDLNAIIGDRNRRAIEDSDMLIANLDGQEIDSGVAAEIGYAAALGKVIFGWRSDFRQTAELGCVVSLQVQHFIQASGGAIVTGLDDLIDLVRNRLPSIDTK